MPVSAAVGCNGIRFRTRRCEQKRDGPFALDARQSQSPILIISIETRLVCSALAYYISIFAIADLIDQDPTFDGD